MKNYLKRTPLSISGIALALAALGNLLEMHHVLFKHILNILCILLIVIYLLKVIFDFDGVKRELSSAISFSLLATFCMSIILIGTYFFPLGNDIGRLIWRLGVTLNLIFYILFIIKYIVFFKLEHIYPSMFVSMVGLVVGTITGPLLQEYTLSYILFYLGLIGYAFMLGLQLVRFKLGNKFDQASFLTCAIFTAPVSLLATGYISAFDTTTQSSKILLLILMFLIFVSYTLVLIYVIIPNLYKRFYPTLAAFTFPVVISATAFTRLSTIFDTRYHLLLYIGYITQIIACIVVFTVLYRYIIYILKQKEA